MSGRPPAPVRFGTSGWRGVLGDEVTHDRARALVRAIASRTRARAGRSAGRSRPVPRVLVACDGRFASRTLAELSAEELAAAGLRPVVVPGVCATPVVTHALARRRFAAGLVWTASHNPPEHHGVKVFDSDGAGIDAETAHAIERRALRELDRVRGRRPPVPGRRTGSGGAPPDLVSLYRSDLVSLLDRSALQRAGRRGLRVVYDAMHGAGAGVLDGVLHRCGIPVERLRAERDPTFGGQPPDPVPGRLAELRRTLRRGSGLRVGFATDGDADRVAAVDASGRCLRESDVLALLVDHLAATGRLRRGVALSMATGSRVARIAAWHGLAVERHAIGFKHFADALRAGRVDVAGEESGGFAWRRFGLDKDGMLAAGLLCELVATRGEPLGESLRGLARRFGPSVCGRDARAAGAGLARAVDRLRRAPPDRLGPARVRDVLCLDGVRLGFDDGFVMWRRSGTEPVVRVYAEARTSAALARRIALAWRLLERAAG